MRTSSCTSTPAKAVRPCRPIGASHTSCPSRLITLSCSRIRPTMRSWRTVQAVGPPPTKRTWPPTCTPSLVSVTSVGQTTRSPRCHSPGRPSAIPRRSISWCGPSGKTRVTCGPRSRHKTQPRPTVRRRSRTCITCRTGTSPPRPPQWKFKRPAWSRKWTMRSTWPSSSTSTNRTTRTNSRECTSCLGCACTP